MKSFGKMTFRPVATGVRVTNYEPELIAVTTAGNFRVTPPVSKALGLATGDYIMFLNNIAGITDAINEKDPDVVAFCEANGLDIDSVEAANAIHAEFDKWIIAKGVQKYDSKGNALTCRERMSKEDRKAYVDKNFESMVEGVVNGNDENLKAAVTREGATREEIIELLIPYVQGSIIPDMMGSKLANASGLTGVGTSLNFADSNTWNELKSDLGEDAKKFNKKFAINLDELITVEVFDGYKVVNVKAAVLGEATTEEAARPGKGEKKEA